MRIRRPRKTIFSASLSVKISPNVRRAVEELADNRNLSLGEATRTLLEAGIKAVMT